MLFCRRPSEAWRHNAVVLAVLTSAQHHHPHPHHQPSTLSLAGPPPHLTQPRLHLTLSNCLLAAPNPRQQTFARLRITRSAPAMLSHPGICCRALVPIPWIDPCRRCNVLGCRAATLGLALFQPQSANDVGPRRAHRPGDGGPKNRGRMRQCRARKKYPRLRRHKQVEVPHPQNRKRRFSEKKSWLQLGFSLRGNARLWAIPVATVSWCRPPLNPTQPKRNRSGASVWSW